MVIVSQLLVHLTWVPAMSSEHPLAPTTLWIINKTKETSQNFLHFLLNWWRFMGLGRRRNLHHHPEWNPVIFLATAFLIWRILIHSLSFVCPVHPQGWEQLITMFWDCHNTEQQCLPGVSISLASGWGYYYSIIQHLPPHLRICVNTEVQSESQVLIQLKNTNFHFFIFSW